MKKKLFSLITTLAMIISLSGALPAMAWEYGEGYSWLVGADNPSDIVATLKLSDPKNSHSKGELIIEGTGDMEDFSSTSRIPWKWFLEQITSVEISEGITRVGNYSFYSYDLFTNYYGGGSNLTNIKLPSTLKSIGRSAFEGCTSLTNIDLPKDLISIEPAAFIGCTGLSNIVIPDSVISICSQAFRACTSLTSITIPDSVTRIDARVFEGCSDTLTVYCYEGSIVEDYVKYYGINYEIIGKSTNVIDKSKLEEALAQAEKIDTSIYSYESINTLSKAITNGEQVFKNWNSTQEEVDSAVQSIKDAIANLVEKPSETSSTNPPKTDLSDTPSNSNSSDTSSDNSSNKSTIPSSNNDTLETPTTASTTVVPSKTIRNPGKVEKEKKNAEKVMKQAKITRLTVKSKAKKKITVSWKKVSKAKGYQVQVSKNKKFKKSKIILTKNTKNKKLIIKNSKIKSKKTYYVRVRAYSIYNNANNVPVKIYSRWNCKLRKVKVK